MFVLNIKTSVPQAGAINNSYVESCTYSDILTEDSHYLSPEEQAEINK